MPQPKATSIPGKHEGTLSLQSFHMASKFSVTSLLSNSLFYLTAYIYIWSFWKYFPSFTI